MYTHTPKILSILSQISIQYNNYNTTVLAISSSLKKNQTKSAIRKLAI